MAVIINAITNPEFQKKQIVDFLERLRDCLNKKTHYGFKISDYVKSTLGRATVLDQSINRPNNVVGSFNMALYYFFNLTSNLDKSHNPAEWVDNHSKYEKEIIDYYGVNREMNDPIGRYEKLQRIFKE